MLDHRVITETLTSWVLVQRVLVTTDLPSWDLLLQLRSDPPNYALGATTIPAYLHRLPYYPAVNQGRPLSVPAVCALARLAYTWFARRRMIDTPRAHRGRRAASRITPPLSGYGLFLRASTEVFPAYAAYFRVSPFQRGNPSSLNLKETPSFSENPTDPRGEGRSAVTTICA